MKLKHILISTIAASVVLLAGCSTQPVTNTNTIANTSNGNTPVEVVTNTLPAQTGNETVDNANVNTTTNESGEVGTSDLSADLSSEALAKEDTSDWLTYTNEEYGFGFRYPDGWFIKQNWLEQGTQGNKYNVFLQNQNSDSILFFLTTADFVPEEGEGEPAYVTGTPIENNNMDEVLKERGLSIYKAASLGVTINNTYYSLESYGGSKLYLLTIFQNRSKQFPFLTVGSPLLAGWSNMASTAEIDDAIKKFESGNLSNQKILDEYIAIVKTIQY